MITFEVWAPRASTVDLELGGDRLAMKSSGRGWFRVVADAKAGDDYGYVLDGEGPFPDPRSMHQPHGVNGLSRLVHHSTFRWHCEGFRAPPLAAAVIYELHIGTFTPEGTFDAAIARLEHLRDLGITHVELMPVAQWDGPRGWGYDGVHLFAPHHDYGGPDGLKRFVDACHDRGLAVILDVVYNHFGPSGNHAPKFGPYLDEKTASPWGAAMNLGGKNSGEVRRYFTDNALMWLRDYRFDALRLDAVHAYNDASALHFLEELSLRVKALAAHVGRPLALIAESDLNDPRVVRHLDAGGYGIDAQWSDDFHHALHVALTGERTGYFEDFNGLADLAKALAETFVFTGEFAQGRGRPHGRPAGGLPGDRFLAYLQNHDQIGNRATGERSSHLLDTAQLKLGAGIVLTSPYIPMLFMGEEWGASTPFQYFTSFEDRRLGEAVSRGRREEFGSFGWKPEDVPDPQDAATFQRSTLVWDELSREPHRELLQWHRDLIALRKQVPALTDPRLDAVRVRHDAESRWLMLTRGPVTIVANFADRSQLLNADAATILLASDSATRMNGDALELPGFGFAVLQSIQ